MSCAQMIDCMSACPSDDQVCSQACYYDGTLDAQAQYLAIVNCVIEQCGEDLPPDCVNATQQGACAAVFADCFESGGGS